MIRTRRTLFAAGAALGLIGASAVVRSDPIIIWNASASVPIGLYLLAPIGEPKVGDLAAVRAPAPLDDWLVDNGYLGRDTPLLKRVAALPGTVVCREETTITVDGRAVADALERDRLGRPLPVWQGCRMLGQAQVFFLNSDEPASLDGRYFGPLAADTIIGWATPVWTREG